MSETMMGRPVRRNSPAEFERDAASETASGIIKSASPVGASLFGKLGEHVDRGIKAISDMAGLKKQQAKPPVKGGRDPDQQIDDLIRAKGGKQRYSK